uniref:Zinc finger CCHC domain-containing protein 10-like n=1 Tax=Diabrotica virgifera virgifera TaxID=50390 RepID=A0A6P7HHT8_DIAVI
MNYKVINVTSRTQKIMDSVRSKHERDEQCMDQNGTKVTCNAGDIYDTLQPIPNNITDTISGTDAQEDILPLAEIQNVSTTKSILASNENHTINNIADECPEDEKETLSHVKEQNVVITEFDSDYDNRASSSDNYNPENESDSTSSSSSCSTCSKFSSSSSSSKDTSEEA